MQRLEQYDVIAVPCDRIYYDGSFNCRGEFTLQSVANVADSIRDIGQLLYPLWVRPAADVIGIPEGYDYGLIAGHRRYRAVTAYLKWTTIPARVFQGLSERDARILNITENLEREDLNPLEEALAIKNTPWPDGMTLRNVARDLKKDTTWVHKRLRILKVPEEVQQLIASKRVSLLDLEIICGRDTPEGQIAAARVIAESKQGRGRKAHFTGEKLTRSFKRRRHKTEINELIARLLNLGVKNDLALRICTWCAGSISDDELEADIQKDLGTNPPDSLY
jgi:ParB family chromosome partitioning protein